MIPQTVVHLFDAAPARKERTIIRLLKRLGSRRSAKAPPKSKLEITKDPYLLLLLADQELVDGREEQARYLVEAAYESFDQKTRTNVYKLNLAG